MKVFIATRHMTGCTVLLFAGILSLLPLVSAQGQQNPGSDSSLSWLTDTPKSNETDTQESSVTDTPESNTLVIAGIEFVRVPAGSFQMGSPETEPKRVEDEGPSRTVRLDKPFWMSKYEITQGQWKAVMGDNPATFKKGDDYPVETVSWFDCQRFVQRLNSRNSETFRLPTEAEWEYACRAGSQAAFGFGSAAEELTEYAWYEGNSAGTSHRVGQKKPNAWGLHDMHGNVYEWCQDCWRESYAGLPGDGSAYAISDPDAHRVRRGGSWEKPAHNCRSAFRGSAHPDNQRSDVGLRLVLVDAPNLSSVEMKDGASSINQEGSPEVSQTTQQSPPQMPQVLNFWSSLVNRRIERVWQVPDGTKASERGEELVVSFEVDKKGHLVGEPEILSIATDPAIAASGVRCIKEAAPFPPLPENFKEPTVSVVYRLKLASE